MRYLSVDDVIEIHHAEAPEADGFDFGLLESAVMRPLPTVMGEGPYPSIADKAGALFHSLVRNHPFVDGNKRTAVLSLVVFCNLNGFRVEAGQDDLVRLALGTAEGALDPRGIAGRVSAWLPNRSGRVERSNRGTWRPDGARSVRFRALPAPGP